MFKTLCKNLGPVKVLLSFFKRRTYALIFNEVMRGS